MRKIKINKFVGKNIGALGKVEFSFGDTAMITGRNGVGKTTIKNAISWVLNGSTADGEKLIPKNGSGLPTVELAITDGAVNVKIRKQLSQNIDAGGRVTRSTDCYLGEMLVSLKELQNFFGRYLPIDIFKILVNVGGFTALKPAEQRELLIKHFGDISDEQVKASDEALKELDFGNLSASKFIDSQKNLNRKLKASALTIPPQIDLLTAQISESSALEAEKAAIVKKLDEANAALEAQNSYIRDISSEIKRVKNNTDKLRKTQMEVKVLTQRLRNYELRLRKLRDDYDNVRTICPTCKQTINPHGMMKVRESLLAEGRQIKEEYDEARASLKVYLQKEEKLKADFEMKQADADVVEMAYQTQADLKGVVSALKEQLREKLRLEDAVEKKVLQIERLKREEKILGQKITEGERLIELGEAFIRRKMELVTDAINDNFRYAKFKMFDTTKGGVEVNTCEVTLDGVPFTKLSKGEKLKVALDIISTFQKRYEIMLPLILDNAESYTENSIIEVDNQKILFKVVDAEMDILTR